MAPASEKDEVKEAAPKKAASKSTGQKFRLARAPKGECNTGIIFEERDVSLKLQNGVFELQTGHYAGSRKAFFIQALLKNGFEEIKKGG